MAISCKSFYTQKLHFNVIWPEREKAWESAELASVPLLELLGIHTYTSAVLNNRQEQRTQERSPFLFGPVIISKYSQILGQNTEQTYLSFVLYIPPLQLQGTCKFTYNRIFKRLFLLQILPFQFSSLLSVVHINLSKWGTGD